MCSGETYVPRAVLVDTDPTTLHALASRENCPFRRENFVCGHGGTGSNWARGHYAADGLTDRVWAVIRTEAERCDRLQGFQMVHSLGGGTGSGLGSRVADHLRAEYPGRTVNTFSTVWPRPCDATDVAGGGEPFNTALCAARLTDAAHNTYVSDNRALYDTCTGPLAMAAPTYEDLNHLASLTMSGTTAGLRFAGGRADADDMAKRTNDLVPYRRLHFFAAGFAPITHRGQHVVVGHASPQRLAVQLFDAVVSPGRCGGRPRVVMAAAVTFRGVHPLHRCTGRPDALPGHGVRPLFPNNVRWTVCAVPSSGVPVSGTLVANTTAVRDVFDRVRRRCAYALTKRRALHSFADEGTTADDLYHALERIDSLIEEYRSVDGMTVDEENVDDNNVVGGV